MKRKFFPTFQSGLSLVETTVALLLVALVLSLSLPKLSGLLAGKELRSEMHKLEALFQNLTLAAVQKETQLILELKKHSYSVKPKGKYPTKHLSYSFPENVSLDIPGGSHKVLRFHKSGVNSPASIVLQSKGDFCQIKLSLRGRVSSQC